MKKIIRKRRTQIQPRKRTEDLAEIDCFHDGEDVLHAVTQWHQYLRTVARKSDTMTCKVLDIVDKQMLIGSPRQRIDAAGLCLTLEQLMEECPRRMKPELPKFIISLLGEIDEEESYHAANLRRSRNITHAALSDDTVSYHSCHSACVEGPLKTTHR